MLGTTCKRAVSLLRQEDTAASSVVRSRSGLSGESRRPREGKGREGKRSGRVRALTGALPFKEEDSQRKSVFQSASQALIGPSR